ncbi:MAG: 50S ribosomal protein L25 [Firmicutes bacterium]|nr:50S ribosomal protein L25 [Bacillota bacterium]
MNLEVRVNPIRQVRNENKVPGVMYGKSFDSTSIQVEDKDLKEAIKAYGKNMTFKVKLEGKQHYVYIEHVETTVLRPHDIIHFDLRCVEAKEHVFAMIPVVLLGKESFYKSKLYPQEAMTEIQAEYLPGHGVAKFEVDVSHMKLGDTFKVKDLVLGKEIKVLDDPEHAIVTIREVHIKVEVEDVVEEEVEDVKEEVKE